MILYTVRDKHPAAAMLLLLSVGLSGRLVWLKLREEKRALAVITIVTWIIAIAMAYFAGRFDVL